MSTLQWWALGIGELFLFSLYVGARMKLWGWVATAWWLVGAIALSGSLLHVAREYRWPLLGCFLVSAAGLFAMTFDRAGNGPGDSR